MTLLIDLIWFLKIKIFIIIREVKYDDVHKLYIFGSEDHLFISKANGYVEKDKIKATKGRKKGSNVLIKQLDPFSFI